MNQTDMEDKLQCCIYSLEGLRALLSSYDKNSKDSTEIEIINQVIQTIEEVRSSAYFKDCASAKCINNRINWRNY